MTSEYYTLKIATVAGKYPDESGSNTLTFLHTDTPSKIRLRDYSLQMDEDNPKLVRLVFDNANAELTASSYDSTRNTGTLTGGLQVTLTLYSDLTATAVAFFHGQIVTLSQTKGGILEVECESALAKLSRMVADKYWVGAYREEYERLVAWKATKAWPAEIDAIDSSWIHPPLFISLCMAKSTKDFSTERTTDITINDGTDRIAQPFKGEEGDHINRANVSVCCGVTNTATLRASIQEMSAGTPSGTDICYYDLTSLLNNGLWSAGTWYPDNDTGDGFAWADRLSPTKEYAIVLRAVGTLTVVDIKIGLNNSTPYEPRAMDYNISSASAWTTRTDSVAVFQLNYSPWKEIKTSLSYKDETVADSIFVDGAGSNEPPDSNAYYERACVTYFYSTVSKRTILEYLINLVFGTSYDNVSSSITDTLPLFRTAGKSPLESIQQLCGLEEGGLSNRQLCVYDYYSGGQDYICVRGRVNMTASSQVSFSDSSATDSEYRIIDYDLKKSDALKINTVMVIGESANGTPIYATACDWTSRALFGAIVHVQTDKSLRNYPACLQEAVRIKSTINRTEWEGTITVNGCYADIMYYPVAPASGTYVGGRIITVSISELGLSSEDFRVRSVLVTPGQTVLSVSNFDYSKDDEVQAKRQKSRLAENFTAVGDLVFNFYIPVRHASVVTTATLYAELQTSAGVAIGGLMRVKCVKTTDGDKNIYSATFMQGNGYTVSGTPVGRIVLHSDPVASSAVATVTLGANEYFYKLKVSRVMVEVHCDAS